MANTNGGGVYSPKPWDDDAGSGSLNDIAELAQIGIGSQNAQSPKWKYNGPFASNAERLTQQALMAATMGREDIRVGVRPPLPQIRLFPDRFGYENTQRTIYDIMDLDRVYVEPRTSWYSGGPAGYSGSSRNDLGNV